MIVQSDQEHCFGCGAEFPVVGDYERTRERSRIAWYPGEDNYVTVCQSGQRTYEVRPKVVCLRKALEKLWKLRICAGCGEQTGVLIGQLCDLCTEGLTKGTEAVVELKRDREDVRQEIVRSFVDSIEGKLKTSYGAEVNLFRSPEERHRYGHESAGHSLMYAIRSLVRETGRQHYRNGKASGVSLLQRLNEGTISIKDFRQRIQFEEEKPVDVDSEIERLRRAATVLGEELRRGEGS